MSKGTLTTITVFAIGIVVVIAGFFLLDIEKIALNFWAFGSLLFSLIVSLLAMLTLVVPKENSEHIFYSSGLSSAILIYEIAVVISIFFTNSFEDHVYRFVFLQVAINALFFISTLLIVNTSAHVHNSKTTTKENLESREYSKPKRGGF